MASVLAFPPYRRFSQSSVEPLVRRTALPAQHVVDDSRVSCRLSVILHNNGQSWTGYEGTPNCDVNFAGHMDNNMKLNGMNLLLDTLR